MGDALTDPIIQDNTRNVSMGYNNNTDRMKIELPEFGDPSASGCVAIITPSGTYAIPVYLSSPSMPTYLTNAIQIASAYDAAANRLRIELPLSGDPMASGVTTDFETSASGVSKGLNFKSTQTASGIWTPSPGKKYVITDIFVNTAAAGVVDIYDTVNTDATKVIKLTMAANQVFDHSYKKSFVGASGNSVLRYDSWDEDVLADHQCAR